MIKIALIILLLILLLILFFYFKQKKSLFGKTNEEKQLPISTLEYRKKTNRQKR